MEYPQAHKLRPIGYGHRGIACIIWAISFCLHGVFIGQEIDLFGKINSAVVEGPESSNARTVASWER